MEIRKEKEETRKEKWERRLEYRICSSCDSRRASNMMMWALMASVVVCRLGSSFLV